MTKVFVEKPLALPGSAKNTEFGTFLPSGLVVKSIAVQCRQKPVVADDVEVAVVDEGVVAVVKTELDVVHPSLHEDVDHGEVHVAGVGKGQVAHVKGLSEGGRHLQLE